MHPDYPHTAKEMLFLVGTKFQQARGDDVLNTHTLSLVSSCRHSNLGLALE
jgi:hypothetical protein